jgi:hypothetical protein
MQFQSLLLPFQTDGVNIAARLEPLAAALLSRQKSGLRLGLSGGKPVASNFTLKLLAGRWSDDVRIEFSGSWGLTILWIYIEGL